MRTIVIGILLIIAGASGQFVLRGTNSGAWLMFFGFIVTILGIIGVISQKKEEEKFKKEIATGEKPGEKEEGSQKKVAKKDKNGNGILCIYRLPAFMGSRDPFAVNLDGQVVAQLTNGSYAVLNLPEGQHQFEFYTFKKYSITLDVKPGGLYYIKFQVKGISKRVFETVDADEGQADITSLKRIPDDSVNIHFRAEG